MCGCSVISVKLLFFGLFCSYYVTLESLSLMFLSPSFRVLFFLDYSYLFKRKKIRFSKANPTRAK